MIKTKMASPTTNGQQNANNLEPHEPTHKAKRKIIKENPACQNKRLEIHQTKKNKYRKDSKGFKISKDSSQLKTISYNKNIEGTTLSCSGFVTTTKYPTRRQLKRDNTITSHADKTI